MTAPALILTALVTSGLRPNHDRPLELGLLAVDRETFEPVDMFTEILQADPSSVLADCDPFVSEAHTANGLFEAMVEALPAKYGSFGEAARAVSGRAVDFIERNGAAGDTRSPLITFGTGWAYRWLTAHFPTVAALFKNELDLTVVLDVQNRKRDRGDMRAESTLNELYAALKGLRP